VTSIYLGAFSPDSIAVQMIQNVFNWFSATVIFFPFIMFYERLSPIFSPENNLRSLDAATDSLMLLAEKLTNLLRMFGHISDAAQW
jgi:hypothetical protein